MTDLAYFLGIYLDPYVADFNSARFKVAIYGISDTMLIRNAAHALEVGKHFAFISFPLFDHILPQPYKPKLHPFP